MIDYRHLKTMTSATGIFQFAVHDQPDPSSGYTVDDNARALLVALNHMGPERRTYLDTYTKYLSAAQRADGAWCNLKLNNRLAPDLDSDDCTGRAFLACCLAASCDIKEVAGLSQQMACRALPAIDKLTFPRAIAYALIGVVNNTSIFQTHKSNIPDLARNLCNLLLDLYSLNREPGWRWFENIVTYCNAIIPHALFAYYAFSEDPRVLQVARESLGFLCDRLFSKGYLNVVGNNGWWRKNSQAPLYDQQPVDACSTALACLEAFHATGQNEYLEMAQLAHDWYFGKNINKLPLYDPRTGGCYDALVPDGLNLNMGAESLLSLLLAQQAMEKAGQKTRSAVFPEYALKH